MKFKSGRYEGWFVKDVAEDDPRYLEFLLTIDGLSTVLKKEIIFCLDLTSGKIEKIILEALRHRGYSKAESIQILNRVKR